MSTEFLFKFHEIEMLKQGRIYEKFLKRKLELKLVAQLVVGKILKSTEIKFEVTEGKLILLLKHKIMCVEKHSPVQLLCTYNHLPIKIIKVSK